MPTTSLMQRLSFEKNVASIVVRNLFSYTYETSIKDDGLSNAMVFNAKVHCGKFFQGVAEAKDSLEFKLLAKWGTSKFLVPASKTIAELTRDYNIPRQVQCTETGSARGCALQCARFEQPLRIASDLTARRPTACVACHRRVRTRRLGT